MKSAFIFSMLLLTSLGASACVRTKSEPQPAADSGPAAVIMPTATSTNVGANPVSTATSSARLTVANTPLLLKVHGLAMSPKTALAFPTSGSDVHLVLSNGPRECALGPTEQRPAELLVHVHFAPMIAFTAKDGTWQSPAGWQIANVGVSKIGRGEMMLPAKTAQPTGPFDTLAKSGGRVGISVSSDVVSGSGEVEVLPCPDYKPEGWKPPGPPQAIEVTLAGTPLPIRGALLIAPPKDKPSLILTTGSAETCAKHEGDVELLLSMDGRNILMGGPRVMRGDVTAKLAIKHEGPDAGAGQRQTISINGSAEQGLPLTFKGKVDALVCPSP